MQADLTVTVTAPTLDDLRLMPVVALPIERYSPARIREFDEAEQDLALELKRKAPIHTLPTS